MIINLKKLFFKRNYKNNFDLATKFMGSITTAKDNFLTLTYKNFSAVISHEEINKDMNFVGSIYENSYHFLKYKEKYLLRMEKENFFKREDIEQLRNTDNFANLLFSIRYFTTRKMNLIRNLRDLINFHNLLDDKFLLLILKKIFEDIYIMDFEEIDRLFLIVSKKDFRDLDILNQFKRIILLKSNKIPYSNLGNILILADKMNILTNDPYVSKIYSESLISGLIKLNYNDILYGFEGLARLKNVDPYIWEIIQSFLVKKFNKVYKITSLRRLVNLLSAKNVKDTIFWNLTDKYLLYNFEKIKQIHYLLEIISHVHKNLGYTSIDIYTHTRYFNMIVTKRSLKDFKILIFAYDIIEGQTKIDKYADQIEIDKYKISQIANLKKKEKLKFHFKFSLETQMQELEYGDIDILFEKEKNYLSDYNTTVLNDKYFSAFIEQMEKFSNEEKFKVFFEMVKYDSRFIKFAYKINLNENSKQQNLQLNEYNLLLLIQYMKAYENEQNPSVKILFEIIKNNFNEILNTDLETKYYELLILMIPYFPNLLKYLSVELKKKKLNKIINSFVTYKNEVFKKNNNFRVQNYENIERKNIDDDDIQMNTELKFFEDNIIIDYDKLIIIKVLNSLNAKKLNLQKEILEIFNNPKLAKIDLSKSYLLQIILHKFNYSLEDLQNLYNMEFYDSLYDHILNN